MTFLIEDTIHSRIPGSWSHLTGLKDHGSRCFHPLKVKTRRLTRILFFDRGQQEAASKTTLPGYDPSCYLCPGNKRAQGDTNPQYDSTFVFVNDYSAVNEGQAEYTETDKDGSM